ncbi:MAG TPA: hypothetical protein VNY36_09700 [Bacteroidia bacterium]|jgi:hypothetical protein|nr:hypothetical protein [Bacteroidia bacterium]
MIILKIKKILFNSAIVIIVIGALFSSCAKSGVQALTPLSSYNMSAYANNNLITFNATTTDYYDTLLNIYGTWVTNINDTYILNFRNIRPKTGYKGTYTLTSYTKFYTFGEYYAYSTGTKPPPYIFNYFSEAGYTLTIDSYDPVKRTISGVFSFTGYDATTTETININNGVFTNLQL